jgi:hypothetical protein
VLNKRSIVDNVQFPKRDGADDFPESDGTGIDQSLDQYHYQSYDLSVDGGSCNSKNSLVFRSNEWEATFSARFQKQTEIFCRKINLRFFDAFDQLIFTFPYFS